MPRAVYAWVRLLPLALLGTALAVLAVRRARVRPTPALTRALPALQASASPYAAPLKPARPELTHASAPRMARGDAQRSHRTSSSLPKNPKLAWTLELGAPIAAQVTASLDSQSLYAATLGGKLVAISREGQIRWSVDLGDRIYSTPLVGSDGELYVGTDADRFISVTKQGKVRWQLDTDADADTSAVEIDQNKIIFAAGRKIFAVDLNGVVKWTFSAKRKVFTSPALTRSGLIVFGSQDDRVYALKQDGTLAWSVGLGTDVEGGPAIGLDDTIFVGTDAGEVVALTSEGEVRWRQRVGGFVRGGLTVAPSGDVGVGVYGPRPRVALLDEATGAVLREAIVRTNSAAEFGVHGGPLATKDGVFAFGAQDDRVRILDASWNVVWSFDTSADVDAPLTLLDDGTFIVPSEDGRIYAFR